MKNRKKIVTSNTFLVILSVAILTTSFTNTVMAKSLYVIADILGGVVSRTQPVQAYDIGVDGTLTFQAQYDIPHRSLGAVGMAIDADSGFLFITYENSNRIQLLDPITLSDAGTTTAPDALDLAGIKYDHKKNLLYTVDRGKNLLYVYNWSPDTITLTHVPGSPFTLERAHPYGIALDEIDNLLYVANASKTVRVYNTSDWSLIDNITLSRTAISIAIDVKNGFLYTGAGWADNFYLTQYHLATKTEKEVQVEPDAGVMGLRVDPDTGLIYMSTGRNTLAGGDNLLVYDIELNQLDIIHAIGNPTDLAIPAKDIGYNPLHLNKEVIRGANTSPDYEDMKTVEPGSTFTYGISFENNNDYAVTNVTIIDTLPNEVTFITATDREVNGHYNLDEKTGRQTFTWTYERIPPKTSTLLEITVQANPDIVVGTIITNSVTINCNETPPTTTSVDVIVTSNDLNLRKWILGVPEGQIAKVYTNDITTYIIEFNNKDNDLPVTNVIVADELPEEVTFISTGDSQYVGNYDSKSHTYTWTFDSLETGAMVHLELVVSVNPGLDVGTIITNVATTNRNETAEISASVDARVISNDLNLKKWILGVPEGQVAQVDSNDIITYIIEFDNNDNNFPVTNVTVVDELPEEVTFISADDGQATGKYDQKTHTYTWVFDKLETGDTAHLELVVSVNPGLAPDTIITNVVTINSDETAEASASVDVITHYKYKLLNITKKAVDEQGNEIKLVNPGDRFKYQICFDNNNNDKKVTGVFIEDTLPDEVSFVPADGSKATEIYDEKAHTCIWSYDSLNPGQPKCVEFTVEVKPDTPRGTMIINTAKIYSNETDETEVTFELPVGEIFLEVANLSITPNVLRRNGTSPNIIAAVQLPQYTSHGERITENNIDHNNLPILYYDDSEEAIIGHYSYQTENEIGPMVIILFNRAELMNILHGYGAFKLRVEGNLKKADNLISDRIYFGEATVYITRFAGG